MSALLNLALEAGLQPEWEDAAGNRQTVSGDSLRAVLAALDLPAENDEQISQSKARLEEARRLGSQRFLTATSGQPITLPATVSGPAKLHLESGSTQPVEIQDHRLAPITEAGYHRLVHVDGETQIAVCPPRCFGVADLGGSERMWGAAVQLPSLRGDQAAPFGDFGILRQAAAALGGCGADLLAISPVHALFPAEPSRYSPYGPSSRNFLNVLFVDPLLAGFQWHEHTASGELIDWEDAIARRMCHLRHIYDGLSESSREGLARVERMTVEEQRSHAVFDALDAHFRGHGLHGWNNWPENFRDRSSPQVQAFAEANAADIGFYYWLQGLADKSLARAQQSAKEAGMAIGIVTDLAVGVDPGGSDCWRSPHAFLRGLSVGAPPDLLGPDGQDWGLTTFNPLTLPLDEFGAFRETLAVAMAYAGGVRIDHVLGLRRIWAVPHGRSSAEGCYIAFPLRDMLRILALESWRNRAVVVGEDLGTVPEGLREDLGEVGVAGMRVLWFERDEEGKFIDPVKWDRTAAAMTSTHDLPTLAGWWTGRDIEWNWSVGRSSRFATKKEELADRRNECKALWQRLLASGQADGPCPAEHEHEIFVSAACAHVSASACELAIFPMEDLFGLLEQPNLPGTVDEHPNWRRRLPNTIAAMVERPLFSARLNRIAEARRA